MAWGYVRPWQHRQLGAHLARILALAGTTAGRARSGCKRAAQARRTRRSPSSARSTARFTTIVATVRCTASATHLPRSGLALSCWMGWRRGQLGDHGDHSPRQRRLCATPSRLVSPDAGRGNPALPRAVRHPVCDRDRRRHRQPGPAAEEGRAGIVLRWHSYNDFCVHSCLSES